MIAIQRPQRIQRPAAGSGDHSCREVEPQCQEQLKCREHPASACSIADMTDVELMAAYSRTNDDRYFNVFFERHRTFVAKKIAKRAARSSPAIDDNDIDDLVQQTFIKVFQTSPDCVAPDQSLKGWVNTIAKHTYLDFVRKKGRGKSKGAVSLGSLRFMDHRYENDLDDDRAADGGREPLDCEQLEPWAEMTWNGAIDKLLAAMQDIRSEDRDLIDRIFYRGQTTEEVAEHFGVTANCIRKRQARVVKRLRDLMGKDVDDLDRTTVANLT